MPTDLAPLVASLPADGILQNLIVVPRADGRYEVVAAEAIAAETEPYEIYRWDRLMPEGSRPPTDAEAEACRVAQTEIEARETAAPPERRTAEDRMYLAERRRAVGEIERGCRMFTAEQKAGAILVISIDHEGKVRTLACSRGKPKRDTASPGKPAERPLYPASLVEDLSKLRTRALQLEVSRHPALALHILIDAVLGLATGALERHAIQLRAEPFRLEGGEQVSAMPVAKPDGDVAELMPVMPTEPGARWDWLTRLSADEKGRLVAFATARLLNGIVGKFADAERRASFERFADAAGLDMTQHWSPGPEFFARLTKRACLKALEEGVGRAAAENCARLGKRELAEACAERLKGTAWLPEPLRAAAPSGQGPGEPLAIVADPGGEPGEQAMAA